MNKKYFISTLVILSAILFLQTTCLAEERIRKYWVNIIINPDSSLNVSESIQVKTEGQQIKRGIYRDFPTKYKDENGIIIGVDFNINSILRDSKKEDYRIEDLDNGKRIYIGNKNFILPTGEYNYKIVFETTGQLGFFPEHDELYFNAIGLGWIFPIDDVQVLVTLPKNISSNNLKVDGFTGPNGSRNKNFSYHINSDNSVLFTLTKGLNPHEGFTFVLGFPKGIVKKPSMQDSLTRLLKYNYNSILAALASFFGFIVLFGGWVSRGIDPPKGTIIPRFQPPHNLGAPEVAYLSHMRYVPQCLSSAIVSIATKGGLKIEERELSGAIFSGGKRTDLILLDSNNKKLTNIELDVIDQIFNSGTTVSIENSNHTKFQSARSVLSSHLSQKLSNLFSLNRFLLFIGLAIQYAAAFVITKGELHYIGFIFFGVAIFNTALFTYLIKAYSDRGREIMDEIEGFKMYLNTAENENFKDLKYPELSQNIFEEFLPYAVALGTEAPWMKAFKNSLEKAGIDPNTYQPVFYSGGHHYNNLNTMSDLGSSLNSTITSASSPPGSSSGFSGGGSSGGSSGGGGGGGGGGGW